MGRLKYILFLLLAVGVMFIALTKVAIKKEADSAFCEALLQPDLVMNNPLVLNDRGAFVHDTSIRRRLPVWQGDLPGQPTILEVLGSKDCDILKFIELSSAAGGDDLPDIDTAAALFPGYRHLLADLKADWLEGGAQAFADSLRREYAHDSISGLRQAVAEYLRCPVNEEGFRSIPLKPFVTDRIKLMLIGDSFTYGMSAMPLHHSYADQLLLSGRVVYNLGVPSTNTVNYYHNVRKYAEELKPDLVIVFYYVKNDLVNYTIPVEKGFVPYHETNYGWVNSFVNGKYYPDKDQWLKAFTAHCEAGLWELAWKRLLRSLNLRLWINGEQSIQVTERAMKVSNNYLQKLADACGEAGAEYVIIPVSDCNINIDSTLLNEYATLFDGLNVIEPPVFDHVEDYRCAYSDWHFSNRGHHRMADFVNHVVDFIFNGGHE